MNKYLSRITSSSRGKEFNILSWPFLLVTLTYGVAFGVLIPLGIDVGNVVLYSSMNSVVSFAPVVWGLTAVVNIVLGVTFLLFNRPPYGRVSGLIGFMLWVWAGFCYTLGGEWLLLVAIALPNMFFWIWQYLTLSIFRSEDAADRRTMENYDAGRYDDEDNPKDAKIARDDNRGRDAQSEGSYDNPDDGSDSSRSLSREGQ